MMQMMFSFSIVFIQLFKFKFKNRFFRLYLDIILILFGILGKSIMHDPMAMRPFMGYNFGHYLQHWLDVEKPGRKVPDSLIWYATKGDMLL